jgi:hypothetical protein
MAPIGAVASGQGWRRPSAWHGCMMVIVGCLGFASQCCLTYGLQREKSAVATPFKMTDVVFAYLFQQLFVVPRVPLIGTSVAGACVIIFSLLVNVSARSARDRRAAARELLPSFVLPIAPAPGPPKGEGLSLTQNPRSGQSDSRVTDSSTWELGPVRTRIAFRADPSTSVQSDSADGGGKAEDEPQQGGSAVAATGRKANALTQVVMTHMRTGGAAGVTSRRHGGPRRNSAYSQLAHGGGGGGGGEGDGEESDAEGSEHCSDAGVADVVVGEVTKI